MVDIQSKEVIDKISDDLKVQPSLQIPKELAKQIQLVYNVNPVREVRLLSGSASDATSGTILTTSLTKRTFIIGVWITVTKSSDATSLFSSILATTLNGVGSRLLMIRTEPLTAAQGLFASISINQPLELEKGTTVSVTNSTAIASIDAQAGVYFYETDPQ